MNSPLFIDLFAEDRAHEEFLKPLIARVAQERSVAVSIRVRSARGGHARAVKEYGTYQKILEKGILHEHHPTLMIIAIDGNCETFSEKRKEIWRATVDSNRNLTVAACPDPHIERWYLADPASFHEVVGYQPIVAKDKCVRDHYKGLLRNAVREAGHPSTLGGIEFAQELVAAMDLYRACKNDSSLKAFIDDLRGKLSKA